MIAASVLRAVCRYCPPTCPLNEFRNTGRLRSFTVVGSIASSNVHTIALVTATATVVYSQRLAAGFLIATISFFVVAIFYGRKIWRTYRSGLAGNSPLPVH